MATVEGNGNNSRKNGGPGPSPGPIDDLNLPSSPLLSLLQSKDDAFQVIKSNVMDALNKEVKSLDEDSWMFEGPRSRINLISKPVGSLAMRNGKSSIHWSDGLPS